MKRLKRTKIAAQQTLLTREQLKNLLGGDGTTTDVGETTTDSGGDPTKKYTGSVRNTTTERWSTKLPGSSQTHTDEKSQEDCIDVMDADT